MLSALLEFLPLYHSLSLSVPDADEEQHNFRCKDDGTKEEPKNVTSVARVSLHCSVSVLTERYRVVLVIECRYVFAKEWISKNDEVFGHVGDCNEALWRFLK